MQDIFQDVSGIEDGSTLDSSQQNQALYEREAR